MTAGEKGLIRFEDVYEYAFTGAHCGRLEDEMFDVIVNAIESVPKVDAVPVNRIELCKVIIDNEGTPELKLRIGDRYFILRTDPVNVREVVHSCFVRVADFGDGEGCFGYCEKCGTVHHAQSPAALKADYRWCRWCGAKMDGGAGYGI